ncbi:MAG: DNA-directed RNA polymerase subunit beta' [Patescibacteria group bacterium]
MRPTENKIPSTIESIQLRLASPEDILQWSHGEVVRPETINYRTARPERDGLFDERIFGPVKDWECYCGKYRRIRYKGIVCDKCGVEVTRSIVRRERFGHIQLASPVAHIWFLRGTPSRIGALLDVSVSDLEKVIYFASYIITKVDIEARDQIMDSLEKEYKSKIKKLDDKKAEAEIKEARDYARDELKSLTHLRVVSEIEYFKLSRKYGEVFEASIGAEPIRNILSHINLPELRKKLEKDFLTANPIQKKKILKRLIIVKGLLKSGVHPEWMFMTVIPIIPPDLRPMVPLDGGRYASSDLNDLYRRVINRNNRLKKLNELNAPEVITRNEKRMLQEAVDALLDNSIRRGSAPVASQVQRRPLRSLADILKGKQGRFRQNLLGKRVDYSGRSVIVVGPDLKLHQCGIPKEMALELFKPFVIHKIIEQEIAHNIRGAGRIIEDRHPVIWAILEDVIKNKMVLLNRAPTLHRLGIQAFQPILIEGHAIQIHPMVCTAFNADFDGDQMAVHVPLTDEAQNEARTLMASTKNLLKPANGTPIINPTKDMVLGCYWVTVFEENAVGEGKIFASEEDAVLACDFEIIGIRAKIKVRIGAHHTAMLKNADIKKKSSVESRPPIIETSVGRILFNRLLPAGFDFVNEEMRSKNLEALISSLIRRYGNEMIPSILDRIKKFGFEYATRSGISWGIHDLQSPPEKKKIIERAEAEVATIKDQYQRGLLTDWERYSRIVVVWLGAKEAVLAELKKSIPKHGAVYSMIDSGARGGWVQTNQMAGMKGSVVNPSGRIIELPIISSYKEGLNVLEYFISTHGARKGTADTALKTATAGYLTRRLVDTAQDVVIAEDDCETKNGIRIFRSDSDEIGKPIASRIISRYIAEDTKNSSGKLFAKRNALIDEELAKKLDESDIDGIAVRSPITCRSLRGICKTCYGLDLAHNKEICIGEAAGIVAAQAIGEPGTQLTMRTFHIGGVAGSGDITSGLPRVEEVFEARHPKGEAILSDVDGEVIEILELNREKVVRIKVRSSLKKPRQSIVKTKKKSVAVPQEGEIHEIHIPRGIGLLIKKDSTVSRGMIITDGHADLTLLYKLTNSATTQRYIIKEVQKIYSRQGASIHDKHIEIIARQMFTRVKIKDPGDTPFTVSEVVGKDRFREENRRVIAEGKRKATAYQLLFGVTKSALNTDSVFAAASFIETTRVLIRAAIEGRRDYFRGLKENVIIGHLIPAGTGLRNRPTAKR